MNASRGLSTTAKFLMYNAVAFFAARKDMSNNDRPVLNCMTGVTEQPKVPGVALADSAATSHVSNRTTSRDTSRKSFSSAAANAGPESFLLSSSSSAGGGSVVGGRLRRGLRGSPASLLPLLSDPPRLSVAVVELLTLALGVASFVT